MLWRLWSFTWSYFLGGLFVHSHKIPMETNLADDTVLEKKKKKKSGESNI